MTKRLFYILCVTSLLLIGWKISELDIDSLITRTLSVTGKGSVDGYLNYRKRHIEVFSDTTLLAEWSGSVITNDDATGPVEITLPSASEHVHFELHSVSTDSMIFICAPGDSVYADGDTLTWEATDQLSSTAWLFAEDTTYWVAELDTDWKLTFASGFVDSPSVRIEMPVQNVWYTVDSLQVGDYAGFSELTDSLVTVFRKGAYETIFVMSGLATNPNDIIEMAVFVNDVRVSPAYPRKFANTTDAGSFTAIDQEMLYPDDVVKAKIRNTTGGDDFIIEACNFNIKKE